MTIKQYTKEILVKDYFDIHQFYSNIYGINNTIILMQVGSFHEAYCTDNKGLDLVELSQKLDVVCTKKNGNKELSDSNPRMLGFPVHVTHSFIEKLINLNFTIILIDQTTEPPNPKREVTGIYTPSTYVEKNNNKSNYLVSIVIDKVKTKIKENICIGIAAYELSTGVGYFYETYSTNTDDFLALDDTLRFLDTISPREYLLVNKITNTIINMSPNDILQYLQLDNKNIFNVKIENQEKIKYQEKILLQVFPVENQLSIFENLEISLFNYSRLALVNLLEYCLVNQKNLLTNIKKPINFTNDQFLYLGNHALDQLNVFSKNSSEKGLFNIINFTKTSLGNRYLMNAISKPLINKDEIVNRYNAIEKLINNDYYKSIQQYIEDVYDLEKLNRRINIGNMHPYELYQLYISFYQISKLIEYLKENKLDILHNNKFNKLLTKTNSFITYITNKFNLDKLNNTNFTNYFDDNKTFYNLNIYSNIDELVKKIEVGSNFIDHLKKELESLLADDKSLFSKPENSLITSKFNERDGHYMLITNRRCKILKEKLKNKQVINIGGYELKISDLEFTELPKSSNTKINCFKIKEISNEIIINKQKLALLNKNTFKEELLHISSNFNDLILYWSNEIGYLDFINSGAISSIKNKYTKPEIIDSDVSFFKGTSIRHPIIEIINKDFTYVPHSIGLGGDNDLDGILLYGINSSGKSTLMKSIGLNIILAQIGYYVSAEKFVFSPYTTLFTRILGNDNMFKGLSSFMVETMELTAILKRNNKNTLVIADEICRGTEEKSANIIVSYMLETLSKSKSSFITATHLHKLVFMDCIKKLNRVKAKHLKITYDVDNDRLIYDRHLSEGQGETFYGLQVAKYLMKDNYFNTRTTEILQEYEDITPMKKSNYNNDFMLECEICKNKKNLESHHIIPQKDFDINETHKSMKHIKKDDYSNIVTLCSTCHDKIDTEELVVNGWIETSNGKKLDYHLNEKKNITKYSQEIIDYIKEMKKLNDIKMVRIYVKEKFNKKISTSTIQKYWLNIKY